MLTFFFCLGYFIYNKKKNKKMRYIDNFKKFESRYEFDFSGNMNMDIISSEYTKNKVFLRLDTKFEELPNIELEFTGTDFSFINNNSPIVGFELDGIDDDINPYELEPEDEAMYKLDFDYIKIFFEDGDFVDYDGSLHSEILNYDEILEYAKKRVEEESPKLSPKNKIYAILKYIAELIRNIFMK